MSIEEVATKMDALDAWNVAVPCHWALKPHGSAFPYFCCTALDRDPLKVRVLLLDGWQTFHDFVRMKLDGDFGFCSSTVELPHFELLILHSGEKRLFRHETGYAPRLADERECELCTRMLWEMYGVMMRLESDKDLPLRFAESEAIFARIEGADGTWRDEPMKIPKPRPHVEQVTLAKKTLAAAKDLPLRADEAIELDMRIVPGVVTREKRPRILYLLSAVDVKTGTPLFLDRLSLDAESGLRGLWESLAPRVLAHFIERHAVPGEVRVSSGRTFRLMRPLCLELPFKLSRVPELAHATETLGHVLNAIAGQKAV